MWKYNALVSNRFLLALTHLALFIDNFYNDRCSLWLVAFGLLCLRPNLIADWN